jgi:hypothetical protein
VEKMLPEIGAQMRTQLFQETVIGSRVARQPQHQQHVQQMLLNGKTDVSVLYLYSFHDGLGLQIG